MGSRTSTGSWVEFFLIIVNGLQSFALVMKSSILDLVGLLDVPLFNITILQVMLQLPVFVQIALLTYNLFVCFVLYVFIASCELIH